MKRKLTNVCLNFFVVKKEFENAEFEKLENEIDTSQNDVKSALNTVIQRYKDFCVTSQYKAK